MEIKVKTEIEGLRQLKEDSEHQYKKKHNPKTKDSDYDKTGMYFSDSSHHHHLHNEVFFIHYDGVYGNSGVSSTFSDKLSLYLIRAINNNLEKLFYEALELIDVDIKDKVDALKKEHAEISKLISEIE